jgi:hypothetical protein
MSWLKEAGLNLPDVPETGEEPEIADLDELQIFAGKVKSDWDKQAEAIYKSVAATLASLLLWHYHLQAYSRMKLNSAIASFYQ